MQGQNTGNPHCTAWPPSGATSWSFQAHFRRNYTRPSSRANITGTANSMRMKVSTFIAHSECWRVQLKVRRCSRQEGREAPPESRYLKIEPRFAGVGGKFRVLTPAGVLGQPMYSVWTKCDRPTLHNCTVRGRRWRTYQKFRRSSPQNLGSPPILGW